MARILGVNVPDNKRVLIALTYIYGLGETTSSKILTKLKIDESIRIKDLTEWELNTIRKELDSMVLESDLRRTVNTDIKRLQDIWAYRGIRHRLRLPVRWQTTKNNARTRKGGRKTMASKK